MRFLAAAVLVMFLATPVSAQQSSNGAGRVFGNATCRQKVPCLGDSANAMSPDQLAAAGDTCVSQSFGSSQPGGVFDEIAGVDASGCLSLKSSVSTHGTPPTCCIVTLPDNSCTFECKLIAH